MSRLNSLSPSTHFLFLFLFFLSCFIKKVIPITKELIDEGIEIEEIDLPENSASAEEEEIDEEQKTHKEEEINEEEEEDSDSYKDKDEFDEVERDQEVTDEESTLEPAVVSNLTPIRSPTKMSGKPRSGKKKRPSVKHPKSTEGICVNGIPSSLRMGSFTKINRTTRQANFKCQSCKSTIRSQILLGI